MARELEQLLSGYENSKLIYELKIQNHVDNKMGCFIEGGELLNQMKWKEAMSYISAYESITDENGKLVLLDLRSISTYVIKYVNERTVFGNLGRNRAFFLPNSIHKLRKKLLMAKVRDKEQFCRFFEECVRCEWDSL